MNDKRNNEHVCVKCVRYRKIADFCIFSIKLTKMKTEYHVTKTMQC